MINKEEVLNVIETEVYYINNVHDTAINTNNGVLNVDFITREKKRFFTNSSQYLLDDIIHTTQSYPENDISDVTLSIDAVVLKRGDFELIKQYIQNGGRKECQCARSKESTEIESA